MSLFNRWRSQELRFLAIRLNFNLPYAIGKKAKR